MSSTVMARWAAPGLQIPVSPYADGADVLDELEIVGRDRPRLAVDRELGNPQPCVRVPDQPARVLVVLLLDVHQREAEQIPVEGDRPIEIRHGEAEVPDTEHGHVASRTWLRLVEPLGTSCGGRTMSSGRSEVVITWRAISAAARPISYGRIRTVVSGGERCSTY